MSVGENIAKIEERIQKACAVAGRKREDITLMAVSKFIPIKAMEEAYNCGIRCFGESRVKEALEKLEAFKTAHPNVQLHMIGSLQRNKAKAAAGFFDCIQSVDRLELVEELARHASARETPLEPPPSPRGEGSPLDVLLELHTGEESKSGFADLDSVFHAAEQVLNCANLRPRGLMTMAPFTENVQQIRLSFRQLVKAQAELTERFPLAENWAVLSMGMSNDFEIAIEEGANMLRIGSLIFKDL